MKPPNTPIHDQADQLLAEIARLETKMDDQANMVAKMIEVLTAPHQLRLAELETRHKASVKALKALGKKHQATLFNGKDRVDLAYGALLYQTLRRVIKSRKVTVQVLEDLGFDQAVKIAKSVDWDEIEKWPDERLVMIGTQRKPKTTLEYDLRGNKNDKGKKAKKKKS